MKIEICYSTINNPQGNSLVERIHRTINEILRIHKSGKSRKEIEKIIFRRLNLPVHRTIGTSPFTLFKKRFFGSNAELPDYESVLENANKKSKASSALNKKILTNTSGNKLRINDEVMIRNKINRKQDEIWKGPFHIVKVKEHCVEIKKGMVIEKVNKRNIRKLRGGEDVETKNRSTKVL